NGRRDSSKLKQEELESIKRELDGNAARRRSAHAGILRVIVDGNECAHLDLSETLNTRFHLDSDAELIEVRSQAETGEEVSLALRPLVFTDGVDELRSSDTSITLEGGQKVSIVVSPRADESGATVDVTYRETNLFRAASLS